MAVNFNSQIFEALPDELALAQRALFFADTLFETVRVFSGKMPLFDRHWNRLSSGLNALGFQLPDSWNASYFQTEMLKICPLNARARLSVWRSPGGLYAPLDHAPQFLITAQDIASSAYEWLEPGIMLGVAENARLPVDAFSNFKTLNAARYVAAALEAQRQGCDDVLILNTFDRICEATSSNVFWWENGTLCTIPLSEGCVAGIQREWLLQTARSAGLAVQEKPATFAALQNAGEIFLTNAVRGMTPVGIFNGRALETAQTKRFFTGVVLPAYLTMTSMTQ